MKTADGQVTTVAETPSLVAPQFNRDQIELIKRTVCRGATDDELNLFLYQCARTKLDPLLKQIHGIKRMDRESGREVMSIQTGIDGLRLIAERTGKYVGQLGPYWCGKDSRWLEVWIAEEAPLAARVAVLRNDFKEPLWGTARLQSYIQLTRDRETRQERPTRFWRVMPDVLLAKCAEALALRKAFPQELSGIYAHEEMMQATRENITNGRTEINEPTAGLASADQRRALWAALVRVWNGDKEHAKHWLEEQFKQFRPPVAKPTELTVAELRLLMQRVQEMSEGPPPDTDDDPDPVGFEAAQEEAEQQLAREKALKEHGKPKTEEDDNA